MFQRAFEKNQKDGYITFFFFNLPMAFPCCMKNRLQTCYQGLQGILVRIVVATITSSTKFSGIISFSKEMTLKNCHLTTFTKFATLIQEISELLPKIYWHASSNLSCNYLFILVILAPALPRSFLGLLHQYNREWDYLLT